MGRITKLNTMPAANSASPLVPTYIRTRSSEALEARIKGRIKFAEALNLDKHCTLRQGERGGGQLSVGGSGDRRWWIVVKIGCYTTDYVTVTIDLEEYLNTKELSTFGINQKWCEEMTDNTLLYPVPLLSG